MSADTIAALHPAHRGQAAGGIVMDGSEPSDFDVTRAYDAHGHALFGFAVNALRDRGAAEDCVQETFLRAWRARDRYDPSRASDRTWLFAIARNVIADALRARERMPRPTAVAVESAASDIADDVDPGATDPLERLHLVGALATLSAAHREVLVAVHVYGLSYDELAERTGVSAATLRTRAFYALRALRPHLDESKGPR
jgi:RNA polymerase sigma-70 factor, ECF subfamily